MPLARFPAIMALAACGGLGIGSPARADAIEGHWSTEGGVRLSIAGPAIETPGGARLQGNDGRHDVTYTAPATDPGSGGRVVMHLMREDGPGLETMWRRCGPATR